MHPRLLPRRVLMFPAMDPVTVTARLLVRLGRKLLHLLQTRTLLPCQMFITRSQRIPLLLLVLREALHSLLSLKSLWVVVVLLGLLLCRTKRRHLPVSLPGGIIIINRTAELHPQTKMETLVIQDRK
jgi:UDP-N-acetylglucosamine enolpyruvyl transferase